VVGFGEQSTAARLILPRARFTLLIFLNGHLDMPCCLHMRFIVVGHTAD
jgi:hypothetical protein